MVTFEDMVKRRLEMCERTLTAKEQEYADGANRFHNFDAAARVDNETPERALWGMAKKHLVSVMDLVEHPGDATEDLLDEKITDMINYLLLLEGLLRRRMGD